MLNEITKKHSIQLNSETDLYANLYGNFTRDFKHRVRDVCNG